MPAGRRRRRGGRRGRRRVVDNRKTGRSGTTAAGRYRDGVTPGSEVRQVFGAGAVRPRKGVIAAGRRRNVDSAVGRGAGGDRRSVSGDIDDGIVIRDDGVSRGGAAGGRGSHGYGVSAGGNTGQVFRCGVVRPVEGVGACGCDVEVYGAVVLAAGRGRRRGGRGGRRCIVGDRGSCDSGTAAGDGRDGDGEITGSKVRDILRRCAIRPDKSVGTRWIGCYIDTAVRCCAGGDRNRSARNVDILAVRSNRETTGGSSAASRICDGDRVGAGIIDADRRCISPRAPGKTGIVAGVGHFNRSALAGTEIGRSG